MVLLAQELNTFQSKVSGNDLNFSPSKRENIVFTWRRWWILPQLLLRGEPLARSTRLKYLEVILNHKLKWGEHVRDYSNLVLGLLA